MPEKRQMISMRLPPNVLKQLEAWREMQPVPPERTAIVLRALIEWLERNGAPPLEPMEPAKRGRRKAAPKKDGK